MFVDGIDCIGGGGNDGLSFVDFLMSVVVFGVLDFVVVGGVVVVWCLRLLCLCGVCCVICVGVVD